MKSRDLLSTKDGEHQARKRKERETITLSEQEEKVWVWFRRLRAVVLLADKESKHQHQHQYPAPSIQPPKYRYQWSLQKIQSSRYQNCMETRNEKHRSTLSLHTVVVTITRNGQIKWGNSGPSCVSSHYLLPQLPTAGYDVGHVSGAVQISLGFQPSLVFTIGR